MPYNITALFVVLDEFCKVYEEWEKHRLIDSGRKRHRACEMSLTELDDPNYRISQAFRHSYNGVSQRWVMVFLEHAYQRECITLEKKIAQEQEAMSKKLWHLGNTPFTCEKDALKALKTLVKQLKYHTVSHHLKEVHHYNGKGRPKKDSKPEVVQFHLVATLSPDTAAIAQQRLTKGRFILATNQLDETLLANADMLYEYKHQTHTEAGFRFIKGNAFEVSGVFLKKPERIQALMMVMILCLMIYNLAQYFLREGLRASNETIPDQLNKPTQKPTMAWVCRKFHGIHLLYIQLETGIQELTINLTELLSRIIRYFGSVAEKIYGLSG